MEQNAKAAGQVANAVRGAIALHGKTQSQVAKGAGIPLTTLSRRLTGAASFDIAELSAIAEYLDIRVSEIIATSERLAERLAERAAESDADESDAA